MAAKQQSGYPGGPGRAPSGARHRGSRRWCRRTRRRGTPRGLPIPADRSLLSESSPDAFVALAGDGGIKLVNPASQAMSRIEPAQVVTATQEALDAELCCRAEVSGRFAGVQACFGAAGDESASGVLRLRTPRTAILRLVDLVNELLDLSRIEARRGKDLRIQRCWRADKSGSTSGTGLGIAIVQEILALLGGSLEVRSQLGAGTAVTPWLPTGDPGVATHDAAAGGDAQVPVPAGATRPRAPVD